MSSDFKTSWDFSILLEDESEEKINDFINKAIKSYSDFVKKWKDNDSYLKDAEKLKEALDDYEFLSKNYSGLGLVSYYFWLKYQKNQNDPNVKSWNNKIYDLEAKISNDIEFFTNRLSKVPPFQQNIFLNSELLLPYKHFLKRIFEVSKYILTEPEEKILNLKSATSFDNWVKMVSEFINKETRTVKDENGNFSEKSFSELLDLIKSQNKEIRDLSAQALNDIFQKYVDIAEHEINSILKDKQINDELRGYARPDTARHISDDIDSKVVDMLVEVVSQRNDIPRRFYALKAKLMGVDKLEYHERNVPLGSLGQKYDFNTACFMISDVLRKLDNEFESLFLHMLRNGQIDAYPSKGKVMGAFCSHKRIIDPSFILVNFNGTLDDILTLAHETGHAINNYLIAKKQHALYFGTPLCVAEVASVFTEDFVFEELSKNFSSKERLYLIMEKLGNEVSTVFRQIACYRFEQELHATFRQKGYLTKEEIGSLFSKHMQNYMGDCVKQSPGSENWWVYWGHIRSFFYVYSYASGELISKYLQDMFNKDPKNIDKIKNFLSVGLSESPLDAFSKLGIDITTKEFWEQGVNKIDELLRQAESLAF